MLLQHRTVAQGHVENWEVAASVVDTHLERVYKSHDFRPVLKLSKDINLQNIQA